MQVAANVVRIVGVEGPLLGFPRHQVYFNASGGHWADRELVRDLNRAITLAEKLGQIVSDNLLSEEGVKPKTTAPLYPLDAMYLTVQCCGWHR